MADRTAKGRDALLSQRGTANPAAKLNDDQVAEIRRLASTGMGPRAIAPSFGVSHQHVSKILRGLKWGSPPA